MKKLSKKINAIFLCCLVIFAMMPVTSAFAYTGGLLDGKTLNYGPDQNTIIGTFVNMTDGNNTTRSDIGVAGTNSDTVWYAFPSPVTIDKIYLNYYSGTLSTYNYQFYDSSGNLIISVNPTTLNGLTDIANVSNVSKVAVYNSRSFANGVYELDVIEGDPPPDTTPPAVPAGLTGTAGDGQVDLSWTANATDTSGYNLYMDGTKINTSLITGTTYTKTGLINGTAYVFEVSAVDLAGNESAKSSSITKTPEGPPDTTPPAVPTGLTGIAGDKQVQLTWTLNSDDATGYNVYMGNVKQNTSPIAGNTYTVTGLTNGTSYIFNIAAVDAPGNESAKSGSITKIPFKTLIVNLVPNGTSIIVQVSSGQNPYDITWTGGGSDTFDANTYTIEGLSKDTDYTVTVTDDDGSSFTGMINTGSLVGYIPPVMPNPTSIFQDMIDTFGVSGDIGLAIMMAAVSLGVICILGLFGWRLSKKWLSSAK